MSARLSETVSVLDPGPADPPVARLRGGLFVAWKAECFRSRASARTLGCPVVFLGAGGGSMSRYLGLMFRTWRLLRQRRPRTVVCLNQPPMLPLTCTLWTLIHGGQVIQDFHSGAFSHRRWRPFQPLYRWMVRRAPVTLAHNRIDAERLQRWRAATALLPTLPGVPPPGLVVHPAPGRPRFLFVCTFAEDEPVKDALAAFTNSPEADFWVTGNFRKANIDPPAMPSNVRLLGFVDYDKYLQAMASSTAVITLSTRSHIMQMAVEEAITLGVPVLTNRSETLQETLGDAGVFVEISVDGIATGVRDVLARSSELALAARRTRARCWVSIEQELIALQRRAPDLFV